MNTVCNPLVLSIAWVWCLRSSQCSLDSLPYPQADAPSSAVGHCRLWGFLLAAADQAVLKSRVCFGDCLQHACIVASRLCKGWRRLQQLLGDVEYNSPDAAGAVCNAPYST